MILTEKTADHKVDRLKAEGMDIEWNGWEINTYKPFDGAFMRSNGVFRNGQWCLKKVYPVGPDGKWQLYGIKFKG